MAEHVDMDRSFISDLENGKKEICIRNLEVLAMAFEISVSQLMPGCSAIIEGRFESTVSTRVLSE
jgi:hypothetical protein